MVKLSDLQAITAMHAEEYEHDLTYPITEKIHAEELSIPMNQAISQEEATIVADAINSFSV